MRGANSGADAIPPILCLANGSRQLTNPPSSISDRVDLAVCGLASVTRLHPHRCDEIQQPDLATKDAEPTRLALSCTLA